MNKVEWKELGPSLSVLAYTFQVPTLKARVPHDRIDSRK